MPKEGKHCQPSSTSFGLVDRFMGNYSATGRANSSSGRGKSTTPLVLKRPTNFYPFHLSKTYRVFASRRRGLRILCLTNRLACRVIVVRVGRVGGGVACYVAATVPYDRLLDIEDNEHEVMWIRLRLHKLPRRFASIVIACIYHPPNSDNSSMREYSIATLDGILRRHPDWYHFNWRF